MSWEEALEKWAELTGAKEGFYLSHQIRNSKHTAILAVEYESGIKKKAESKKDQMYYVYRPNTGLQFRQESLAELEKKYKKVIISILLVNSHCNIQYLFRCNQMKLKKLGPNSMMHQSQHVHMHIGEATAVM